MSRNARIPPVAGFRFASIACGIKGDGALDLGVVVADRPVPTAAVFTTNQVQAAPVRVARDRVRGGRAQAILVNSGNANACTGKPGMRATLGTCRRAASLLAIDEELVVPASTGVIGELLQADKIETALPGLLQRLRDDGARGFSRAILTTDRGPKVSTRKIKFGKREVTVLGVAKGAGMIHPRMATTLAFVLTDAPMTAAQLRRCLSAATDHSFNVATVDGETSTNDTIVAMASGSVGGTAPAKGSRALVQLEKAFGEVLWDLAGEIVAAGEGAEHVAEVVVSGAPDARGARAIAQRVATSLLVKTAMHGKDANWGRILSAAGMAGVRFDPEKVAIQINDVAIVRRGVAVGADAERKAARIMRGKRYEIRVKLAEGKGTARYLTSDLGHSYVDVNAGYRS